jgi:hypothetical protein
VPRDLAHRGQHAFARQRERRSRGTDLRAPRADALPLCMPRHFGSCVETQLTNLLDRGGKQRLDARCVVEASST